MPVSDDDHYACDPSVCNVAADTRTTSVQLRDALEARDVLRDRLERAEAQAGTYRLAHDHLAAVTRQLVTAIHQHVTRNPAGNHLLTQADRDRLLTATDTTHDALTRDLESYLAEPDNDITADTRIDLTPAGVAAAAQQRLMTGIAEQLQDLTTKWTKPIQALAKGGIIRKAEPCQPGCGIGYHLQGCPHIGAQLGIAPDGTEANTCRCTWLGIGTPEHPRRSLCLTAEQDQANHQRVAAALAGIAERVASVPHVARESKPSAAIKAVAINRPCDPGYEPGNATLCHPCSCSEGVPVRVDERDPVADDPAGSAAPAAWTSMPESWGPYETELQTRLEPMPVAVDELHDAGLVRSGDPDRVVRDLVLAHLEAAAAAAGVELGAFDRRILEWLARGEVSTAQVVIGLIRRAFQGGRGAQRYYDTLCGPSTPEGDDNIMVIMMPSQNGHSDQVDGAPFPAPEARRR